MKTGYSEEDGHVVLRLTREDYNLLMITFVYATATSFRNPGRAIGADAILALVNRVNEGNPHFAPYPIPGERVRLLHPGQPIRVLEAAFRFRTTCVACFEPGEACEGEEGALLEFALHEDGGLFDGERRRWFVEGLDRETRSIIDHEAGRV
jgi:hypothetical protein